MSRFELNNKTAVVTGGGGTGHGIGRSIALAFARAGADVAVVGRHRESLDKVVEEIRATGSNALAVAADVTIPDQVDEMINGVVKALGRVDILVNSVGSMTFGKPEEISPQDWTDSIALNLNSTCFCCAAAGREMISQGGGKIVNIASSSGIKGEEMAVPYAAAKAAVINLTRSLAISWAEHNINVNCIAPGRVEVPDHAIAGMPDEEYAKRQAEQTGDALALQSPGSAQNIADAAVFFASEGSDLMSGETLVVRGAEWASAYS